MFHPSIHPSSDCKYAVVVANTVGHIKLPSPQQCLSATPRAPQGHSGQGLRHLQINPKPQPAPSKTKEEVSDSTLLSLLRFQVFLCISEKKPSHIPEEPNITSLHYCMCDFGLLVNCSQNHYRVEMCSTWNQTIIDLDDPIWLGLLYLNSIHQSVYHSIHSAIHPCFLCFFLYRVEQHFCFFQSNNSLSRSDHMTKLVLSATMEKS